MTAHPTFCLLDLEDGVRTVITIEDPSDCDAEQGAIARIVIVADDKRTASIGLSVEAVDGLIEALRCMAQNGGEHG